MFTIEDEIHAECDSEFQTFEEAIAELRRRASIPWDQPPNVAPCTSWRTCGREYFVTEYDVSQLPWSRLRTVRVLDISAKGVHWSPAFIADWARPT